MMQQPIAPGQKANPASQPPGHRTGLPLLAAALLLMGCQQALLSSDVGIDQVGDDQSKNDNGALATPSTMKVFGFHFPWAKGQSHSVIQYPHAYRAQIWHAIDFDLSYQEPIYAMKPGRISALTDSVDDYPLGTQCQQFSCNQTTNFMIVQHDDGTESSYLHLLKGSATRQGLRVGSQICQGQHIADVGLNGFTSGPHLHVSAQSAGSQSWSDMFSRPTHQIIFAEISPASVAQGGSYQSANQQDGSCQKPAGPPPPAPPPAPSPPPSPSPPPAPPPPAPPPPSSAPCHGKHDGKYCGSELSGYSGSGDDLITCIGGNINSHVSCPGGCQVNPPGVDDVCKSSPCAGRHDGKYCGSELSGYSGSGNDLITCIGGSINSHVSCPGGCQVNPPGVDDVCK